MDVLVCDVDCVGAGVVSAQTAFRLLKQRLAALLGCCAAERIARFPMHTRERPTMKG